jgi:uncharacterized protein YacL
MTIGCEDKDLGPFQTGGTGPAGAEVDDSSCGVYHLSSNILNIEEDIILGGIIIMQVLASILLPVFSAAAGYSLFHRIFGSPGLALLGALAGAILFAVIDIAVRRMRRMPVRTVVGAALGLLVGVTVFAVLSSAIPEGLSAHPAVIALQFILALAFGYAGIIIGARKGEEFSLPELVKPFVHHSTDETDLKILDTSVIIDGRIADICETGFMDGTFLVPQFVLRELQYIADSPDSLKRNRGRRGLDILQRMQKKNEPSIEITDQDFPKVREVDEKLIALARKVRGKIITNDFNLNKVAELNGVPVLNINQLANALKPVVLPGELMKVYILREGKEVNQGVAYLDDGTMVVIDNARKFIGKHVEVHVTSVLQTTAGRMIFTQLREDNSREVQAVTSGGS